MEFTANSRICKLRAFEASGLAFVVNFRLSEHSFNLDYKYLCAVSLDFLFCFFLNSNNSASAPTRGTN